MNIRKISLFTFLTAVPGLMFAEAKVNIAEDDASYGNYNNGWGSDQNSGGGFGPWTLVSTATDESKQTWAGFYVAPSSNHGLDTIAYNGKAWGMYANGQRFEETIAFRDLSRPLESRDTFSLFFEFDGFSTKWSADTLRPGRAGFALRVADSPDTLDDYRKGARFIFETVDSSGNYIVSDSVNEWNTKVKVDPKGAMVSVTPRGFYSYDLEIKTLGDGVMHKFPARRFAGKARDLVQNIAIFALNTETNDVYFSGLQVARPLPPADEAVKSLVSKSKPATTDKSDTN
ncbi:hypothetical protein [Rubellicoccus peritrichatus]|uniref:Uncharacterized protein n=1 Tax=Rubellicoccus peritrichatus TaxID=3080537 RepID=A0AAQ3LCA9_9BACT|nr:hypothetical protein [Puniceicoccus sp. CR14]WOO39424.1 hypothetical protein RZN69_12435 [Puniceicoccus sp. CR14]